jgi:hypothetical protein
VRLEDGAIGEEMTDADELRNIPGYPGYRVTRDGRVMGKRGWLKPSKNKKSGVLSFRPVVDGRLGGITVHRAVMFAWIGPCPAGMECCHNDGDPGNNAVDNLRWDTHSSNMEDRTRHMRNAGRAPWRGRNNSQSKLTEENVREIRQLLSDELLTPSMIGECFGVGVTTIFSIKSGRNWGWLT